LGLAVYNDTLGSDHGAIDSFYFVAITKNGLGFIALTVARNRSAGRRASAGLAITASFISRSTSFTTIAGGTAFASGFGFVTCRFYRTSEGYRRN
jgi:hypothetical protein